MTRTSTLLSYTRLFRATGRQERDADRLLRDRGETDRVARPLCPAARRAGRDPADTRERSAPAAAESVCRGACALCRTGDGVGGPRCGHGGGGTAGFPRRPPEGASARGGRAARSRRRGLRARRSEEHTSELQSLMRTSYAVFC